MCFPEGWLSQENSRLGEDRDFVLWAVTLADAPDLRLADLLHIRCSVNWPADQTIHGPRDPVLVVAGAPRAGRATPAPTLTGTSCPVCVAFPDPGFQQKPVTHLDPNPSAVGTDNLWSSGPSQALLSSNLFLLLNSELS